MQYAERAGITKFTELLDHKIMKIMTVKIAEDRKKMIQVIIIVTTVK